MDLCNFLSLNAQNERKSSNFVTETRLNRDGKAPTKNENGRNVNHRDSSSTLKSEPMYLSHDSRFYFLGCGVGIGLGWKRRGLSRSPQMSVLSRLPTGNSILNFFTFI